MNIFDFLLNYWLLFSLWLFMLSYLFFNTQRLKNKDILNIFIDILIYIVFLSLIFLFEKLLYINLLVYLIIVVMLSLLRLFLNKLVKRSYYYHIIFFISPIFIYILIQTNIDWTLNLISWFKNITTI